jgi:hypothetical protein
LVNQVIFGYGNIPASCRLNLNGVSTGILSMPLQNIILDEGDILSTTSCSGFSQLNIIINGYLKDK